MTAFSKPSNQRAQFRQIILKGCMCLSVAMLGFLTVEGACAQGTLTFNTEAMWAGSPGDGIGSMGPGASTTFGETFVAPSGPEVLLNSFSFWENGPANLVLQAFVFAWSGSLTDGGAVGNPLY